MRHVFYNSLTASQRKAKREEYIAHQEGKCWFCGNDLKGPPTAKVQLRKYNTRLFPKGFFKWPVHLHHSHKTGLTIGAVHSKCNAYMWEVNND